MREQCAINDEAADISTQLLNGSSESLASTCSTATEITTKEKDISPVRSPSEGYKSACGSEYNIDDSDYSLSPPKGSQSKHNSSSISLASRRPTFKDFNDRLNNTDSTIRNMSNSVSPSMTESMFKSTMSLKSDELEERVRKLCQSTTELDEKMRLARLECSFIRAK